MTLGSATIIEWYMKGAIFKSGATTRQTAKEGIDFNYIYQELTKNYKRPAGF